MPENLENPFDDQELRQLIDALICGTINQAQFDELSRKLTVDPAARELYVAELEIESNLRGLNVSRERKPVFPSVKVVSSIWSTTGFRLMLLAFVIFGSALGALAYQNWPGSENNQVVDSGIDDTRDSDKLTNELGKASIAKGHAANIANRSVARITNGQDLIWKTPAEMTIGSWLKPGSFELASGNLEVTFDAGAVVYIAGDSAFEIIDANEIRLLRGSLEADVPEQAIGFKVQTPSGEITDLSTKFGVRVSEKGESDVHVIKGLIEAKPFGSPQSKMVTLKENSAIRMFPDAPPKPVEFSRDRLFDIQSRNNPSKLNFLHFSFDEKEVTNGSVKNSGRSAKGRAGKVVEGGAPNSWVQVDGPFNKALFLSGEGAKIETQFKGVDGNRPRTLLFWVRINPQTPIESAYSFAAWGRSEGQLSGGINPDSGLKWQIGWNPNYVDSYEGTMGAVRTEFGGGYVIGSTDLRDGRWHHIASVFLGGGKGDDVANLVRHYVDGKLESVSGYKGKRIMTHSDHQALSIGDYIGAGEQVFTGYKGWMDEFYLFEEALTPSQIVQIMKQNQPPAAEEIVAEEGEN